MPVYYTIEDSELARRNQSLVIGNVSFADNRVLDVSFSGENATEPVTLTEAKKWCKIDVSDDDAIITELIKAARIICEKYSNISFITKTVTARLLNQLGGIYLPYGPVNSFTSITDDDAVVTPTTSYHIVGVSFKQIKEPMEDEFTAVYTAGYSTLPTNLKNALLNQVDWMYNNRGSDEAQQVSEQSKLILNQVRRVA